MEDFKFEMVTEEEKPTTTYTKESKYDAILDKFLSAKVKLVSIKVDGDKDANYTRTQIKKRLDKRSLNDQILASVVNSKVYLETVTPKTTVPTEEKK